MWVREIRDQCINQGVPFHFKQWGHWHPENRLDLDNDLRVIQLTEPSGHEFRMVALGKKKSGRILDGETWDEFPSAQFSLAE